MARQTLLFTTMARGISVNGDTLPISVIVSPRLMDGTTLAEFPDWRDWTRRLATNGFDLTFHCEGRNLTVAVPTEGLRSDLWEAIFKPETLVRSHVPNDYSERAIFSYPVRFALSALKGIYQTAGVALALPERGGEGDDRGLRSRHVLTSLVRGLDVNWDESRAAERRASWRGMTDRLPAAVPLRRQVAAADIGHDGLIRPERMPVPGSNEAETFHRGVIEPFAVFHHMPAGKPLEDQRIDWDTLLDFHQALSALNNYPALQRALGLVFDLDLPVDFVPETTAANPVRAIAVSAIAPGWRWDVPKSPH